ncbi:hypothetical protein NADFUDRAFT_43375 [Nadsonia fulvescens var. elongata DSM 6958]|uniref:50S ribosomal protein L35 n=1 Tax=Nadsonia fulvescens var. elongata DSM 6958 TaxID=857566 RepID=A0A1E3PG49_9ASCO|nr:hypothetical protein NADFUDRAFT_43375 [Nadsonia fulvescens var. elongata DSM 6958]
MFKSFFTTARPRFSAAAQFIGGSASTVQSVNFGPALFVRTLMKTHHATAKRYKALKSGGYKRGIPGRKHGCTGWSNARNLKKLTGTRLVNGKGNGNFMKKLERLMPYHN